MIWLNVSEKFLHRPPFFWKKLTFFMGTTFSDMDAHMWLFLGSQWDKKLKFSAYASFIILWAYAENFSFLSHWEPQKSHMWVSEKVVTLFVMIFFSLIKFFRPYKNFLSKISLYCNVKKKIRVIWNHFH